MDKLNHSERLRSFVETRKMAFLSCSNLEVSFQTYILAVEDSQLKIYNSVPPEYISDFIKSDSFALQLHLLRIASSSLSTDGKNIIIPFSSVEMAQDIRKNERHFFFSEEKAEVEFLNPYDKLTVIRKPIIEMSSTGVSIRTSYDSKLFEKGTDLENMVVYLGGKVAKKTNSKVIYKKSYLNLNGKKQYQIGLQFF